MLKTKISILTLLLFNFTMIYSNGDMESGRDSAMSLVDSDSYVSSSYLDLDAILDDYKYHYEINPNESITFDISTSYKSIHEIGDRLHIQVSLKTNELEFFNKSNFNYIIYINNIEIIEDDNYITSIFDAITEILVNKNTESKIFLFLKKDSKLFEVQQKDDLTELRSILFEQTNSSITDSFKEAKKDLEDLLSVSINNDLPNKYFWIFDKPIADSEKDISDIFGAIAGLGNNRTEISFCGNSSNFRASTVNRITKQFGGNSYYFKNNEDLYEKLVKDYKFYNYPTVSDLDIKYYNLTRNTPELVKHITTKNLGPGEYHTYISEIEIPSKKYLILNDISTIDENELFIPSVVLIKYYDHKLSKNIYLSKNLEITYTDDLQEQYNSFDSIVLLNKAIKDTYALISDLSYELRRNRYTDSLIKLENQIEVLEYLNSFNNDKLISEDIELLKKYKKLIYDNKDNPLNAFKSFSELSTKKY